MESGKPSSPWALLGLGTQQNLRANEDSRDASAWAKASAPTSTLPAPIADPQGPRVDGAGHDAGDTIVHADEETLGQEGFSSLPHRCFATFERTKLAHGRALEARGQRWHQGPTFKDAS